MKTRAPRAPPPALAWPALLTTLAVACSSGPATQAPTSPTSPPAATATPPSSTATTVPTVPPSATPQPATATPTDTPAETPEPTLPPAENLEVALEPIVAGLERPVYVTQPPGDADRLFVIEQPGRIRVIDGGTLVEQPFLDITGIIDTTGEEQGLLGLAFHPEFTRNGRFFVYYAAKEGDGTNTLAEYSLSLDAGVADPSSGRVLLAVEDFAHNHNGGMLTFGPDGYLYLALGDGGGGGDPEGNGQRLDTLLGKILRVDVDAGQPYAIPADNPFAGGGEGLPEIWAYGLRNPWRFSFDRATGDLWIGDVGQGTSEEIDFAPAGSGGGHNYGWNTYEGTGCYADDGGCGRAGFTFPVYEYPTGTGCAVTGGYVYRGPAHEALVGTYVFADFCNGVIQGLRPAGDGTFEHLVLGTPGGLISSFGEDNAGNLYVLDHGSGSVSRIVAP